jgi:hypothetical protein
MLLNYIFLWIIILFLCFKFIGCLQKNERYKYSRWRAFWISTPNSLYHGHFPRSLSAYYLCQNVWTDFLQLLHIFWPRARHFLRK